MLFRPLRPILFAISVLPSVVSEGSPGSDPLGILSPVDERNRFEGGLDASIELPFLCFKLDSGAVDSPSSAEASRDDVCSCTAGAASVRFRFPVPEPGDVGDDIVIKGMNEAGAVERGIGEFDMSSEEEGGFVVDELSCCVR